MYVWSSSFEFQSQQRERKSHCHTLPQCTPRSAAKLATRLGKQALSRYPAIDDFPRASPAATPVFCSSSLVFPSQPCKNANRTGPHAFATSSQDTGAQTTFATLPRNWLLPLRAWDKGSFQQHKVRSRSCRVYQPAAPAFGSPSAEFERELLACEFHWPRASTVNAALCRATSCL